MQAGARAHTRGFAFIGYFCRIDAEKAMAALNGTMAMEKRPIAVLFCFSLLQVLGVHDVLCVAEKPPLWFPGIQTVVSYPCNAVSNVAGLGKKVNCLCTYTAAQCSVY